MRDAGTILSLMVLGLSGWTLYSATGWPWKAALFPLVVGVPLLLLATIELWLSLAGRRQARQDGTMEVSVEPVPADPALVRRRTLGILGWIGGLFLLVVGIGFLAAVPAFIVAYLRLQAREPWPITLVLSGAAWAAIYGLFVELLHLPLAHGLLQSWLRGNGVSG